MSEVLQLHGLGATVDVRCTGDAAPALVLAMREAWSRCLDRSNVVDRQGPVAEQLVLSLDDESRLKREMMTATQRITRALITARVGQLLMLHAGAVSDPRTGGSLVYVAPSGTGKTTLTRRLGVRFGYLTDETVGIGETLGIFPYPKPLSIRRDGDPVKDEISPDALGLLPAPPEPRVVRVVLLDRRSVGEPTEVEELGFMESLLALSEQSSSLPRMDRPLHRLAEVIDTSGPVLRVRYAEASDVESELAKLIGGSL